MFLKEANFSIWCDFIERSFLQKDFKELVEKNIVNGATSNPAIFKEAILKSKAYKEDIEKLKGEDKKRIYEKIAIKDIRQAADILMPLYEKGDDGFVSIEVDPFLCDDAKGTIEEGKRLFKEINRENVMIKIPATKAGYEAMRELSKEGINVNATLVFSKEQAKNSLISLKEGISQSKKSTKGVISVFVSRFDRKIDPVLKEKNLKEGLYGIMNASEIYLMIEEEKFPFVKTLFASTGVKGENYPQDYYMKNLLYPNCINTAPLKTIEAFLKNKNFVVKKPPKKEEIEKFFSLMEKNQIKREEINEILIKEGIEAFKKAFKEILENL